MALAALGPRICILGPSNSGKSTLAVAIGRARDLPVIHLDRLAHLPHTDWQPRPEAEFIALHDRAILRPSWVIDGKYSRCLPQRLERATGVILIDAPTAVTLFRYLRRTLLERDRHGALEGGGERIKWEMIRHIVFSGRSSRRRYRAMFERIDLPGVRLETPRELNLFYRAEGLRR